MTILRWKPNRDVVSLQDKINRLFENRYEQCCADEEPRSGWTPAVDIYNTGDGYIFKVEVPGIPKENIDIQVHDNTLTIKGEKKTPEEVGENGYHRFESYFGSFSRSFNLPKNADSGKINADLKNGVLKVKIGKVEEKKPKSVSINIK